jgi:hypothetical protein
VTHEAGGKFEQWYEEYYKGQGDDKANIRRSRKRNQPVKKKQSSFGLEGEEKTGPILTPTRCYGTGRTSTLSKIQIWSSASARKNVATRI